MDDDREVIEAFLDGARRGRAGDLYIEGDVLYLHAWWQAAFRLAPDAYIVRAEPPPEPSSVVDVVADGLRLRGLHAVPGEHPLVQAVTYAELSLTGVEWTLWAPDAERGEAALAVRAAPGSEPIGAAPSVSDDPALGDLSAEFARSMIDGMPASVVLAVGLADHVVDALTACLPDCRVEARPLEDGVAACGVLVPHLAIVEASTQRGRNFLLELRAEACGRFIPVAAVTDGEVPPGADVALDPRLPAMAWHEQLVQLLP